MLKKNYTFPTILLKHKLWLFNYFYCDNNDSNIDSDTNKYTKYPKRQVLLYLRKYVYYLCLTSVPAQI